MSISYVEKCIQNKYTDGFFNVSSDYGFLPVKDPLENLPNCYKELQDFMDQLKDIILIPNRIIKEVYLIPDYSNHINNEQDIFTLQSLYRAYCFLTSAYTLELSYQELKNKGKYGKARCVIPEHISIPFVMVSNKIGAYPWLDYHYAYSLGNYKRKDKSKNLHWKNLDMACSFTGTSDETGFIMLHVYINELSPNLVDSVVNYGLSKDNDSLYRCGKIMEEMNSRRKEMWVASNHTRYNDFRVFIMGIKGNDELFGQGVLYQNCFDNELQQFRGQTGAQDNIIPMIDIFSGIVDYYPDNKLTEYLLDLRSYRPLCIQEFFKDIREYYKKNPILNELVEQKNVEGLNYLLKIVDEVYFFRNGHWQFVQKYIMENTKYEYATGGTPIISWLINQIEAVLRFEEVIINHIKKLDDMRCIQNNIIDSYDRKVKLLQDQIIELNNKNYNVHLIYMKNMEYNVNDFSDDMQCDKV
jgi:indoleamine 2,3-dioxygenase